MSELKITKENYEKEVANSPVPVLLDFWADWCGPCRMLSPILAEVAKEAEGFKVGKVNVDEEQELAQAFGVMSIPMLAVVKNGKVEKTSVGVRPKNEILQMLK
ncbi:MAG: thioredoxin [Oscillospiraceae bacterium]|jgi:thioredoxin 1|nr:thioredoxin [Oscillospiraceae bacterium]